MRTWREHKGVETVQQVACDLRKPHESVVFAHAPTWRGCEKELTMDQGSIQSGRIVERYLSGDLLVREAREFEKYCLEHPEMLAELPIPVRLKARLGHRPLADTETGMFAAIPSSTMHAAARLADSDDEDDGDGDDDEVRSPPLQRRTTQILGIGLLLAAIGLAAYAWRSHTQDNRIKTLQVQAKALQIRAPASVQTFKVQPGNSLALGWPDPPQLLELRIDVTESKFSQYEVTIDKEGEARVMQIRRIARDSNNELRLGVNSSAFGPGVYKLQLEGYNWRGELTPAGWVTLKLE
jgi:hypothetical protein